jgi:hypothetical protein
MIYLVSLAVIAHSVSNFSGCCFARCKSYGIYPRECAQYLPSLLGMLVLIYYASLAEEVITGSCSVKIQDILVWWLQHRPLFPA